MKLIRILSLFSILFSQLAFGQYFIGGNTQALGNDCFLLSDSVSSQWGKVWYNQQIDLTQPFELYASLNFGDRDTTGGDGIAFSFHQGGLLAGSGGGGSLGYQNIAPALSIEMDTRENSTYSDPASDHIGLTTNGTVNHSLPGNVLGPFDITASTANVEDGREHAFHIKWNPATNNLKVWFDCDLRIDYTGNIINQFFQGYEFVYWGFTASNAPNHYNRHQVCIEHLSLNPALSDTLMCQGNSLQLDAGLGSQYQWSPSAGLTDDTLRNPIALPDTTTTFTVTITDTCGYVRTESYTHNIIDSNLAILSKDTVTCLGNSVELGLELQGEAPFTVTIFDGTSNTTFNLDSNGNELSTGLPPLLTPTVNTTYFLTGFQAGNSCGTAFRGTQTVTIGILDGMLVTEQDASCNGACDGSAAIFIPHETPSYSYTWPNLTGGNSKPGLCAGTYKVGVNDGNGCLDTVTATINEPDVIVLNPLGPYTACQDETVNVPLAVTGGSGNYVYQWSDGQIGNPATFTDTATRNFSVTVTDDNGCPPAVQTFTINRTDPLTLNLTSDTGMCIGESFTLTATATGGDNVYGYTWSNGETSNAITTDTNQTTTYTVTLSDGCGSTPISKSVTLVVDTFRTHTYTFNDPACIKDPIIFEIDNYDPNTRYTIFYGDGTSQVFPNEKMEHYYEDTGSYHITLQVNSIYCDSVRTDSNAVKIKESPDAKFTSSKDTLLLITDYTVELTNTSYLDSSISWYIDNSYIGNAEVQSYSFSDIGIYEVKLVTTSTEGCTDSTTKEILVQEEGRNFYIPNTFTPNGDGLNDTFGPVLIERDISEYEFKIFSRFGNVVFETTDEFEWWNGLDGNSGNESMQGVYVYQITYTDLNFVVQQYKGKVFLLR